MILSIIFGAVLGVVGTALLFHAKHLDSQKNKEITYHTTIGYILIIVAFLCGIITGVIALNTDKVGMIIAGAAEAGAFAVIGLYYFTSWMEGDIREGHPSNH
jgi:heme/copper-type cytochrome/quinol oxidase subunit 2